MKVVDEHELVAEILRAEAATKRPLVVSVDGLTGSGKSTLSKYLAAAVPAVHVKIDSFVEREQGSYVQYLRFPELAARVKAEIDGGNVVLLDGVCTATVLERLGVHPDVRIYVAKLDDCGDWSDGALYTSGLTEAEAVEQEEAAVAPFGESLSDLRREIMHYHFAFRPWESADLRYVHRDAPEA